MGHVTAPTYANNERSYYQLTLDLTQVTDAFLAFDWTLDSELGWDGWNLLAAQHGSAFDSAHPLNGTPSPYNRFLGVLGAPGSSGIGSGHAVFDITPFAGKVVDLRLQFASDYSIVGRGVTFDNLAVTGTAAPVSGVPEPASWALMILGFLGAGTALRRQRLPAALR
jgi:hypothetical protein